ncbi:MAG TPA: hypothetical protein VJS12_02185 [Steroidobacteraceae bacterium]|nr:hypothetical protein [Steroidobacteraceae bacterium]
MLIVQFNRAQRDTGTFVFVAGIALSIATFVGVRRYRDIRRTRSSHMLTLLDDAMVFRDGEVESRVPYSAITRLKIPRNVHDTSQVDVTLHDGETMRLHGYERLSRIVEVLQQKVSPDLVRTRGWG